MAVPRWQYIPTAVLDDEELANQSRAWADEQSKRLAADWARSNAPDPLAGLRRANPHLARVEQDLARPPVESAEPEQPSPLGDISTLGQQPRQPRSTFQDTSQFGQPGISQAEAYAVCGPAAAVRLASVYGNNIPLAEALKAAKQVGWTEQGGMNGIQNQKRLLDDLGVPTTMDLRPTQDKIVADAVTGNPVTISTPRHYFTVTSYDQQSGKLYVGKSGTDLKGGSDWMTLDEIRQSGGGINGALFANNPQTELPSPAVKIATTQPADTSLQGLARSAALQFGIDPDIFVKQIQQESGFKTNSRSEAGARGIAQFMPGTAQGVAKQMGVSLDEFWRDPGLQLQGAAQHMSDLMQQFGGDIKLALAAYNAGPGNVQKYGGVPPFEETQRYIKNILGGSIAAPVAAGAGIASRAGEALSDPGATASAALSSPVAKGVAAFGSDLSRTQRETNPLLAALAPAFRIPDVGSAASAGAQAAGIPGSKQTGQRLDTPLGELPLGPSELIGFAAGMAVPGGPGGKAAGPAKGLAGKAASALPGGAGPPRPPTPGGPGRGGLDDIFDMWARNREVRAGGSGIRDKLSGIGLEFERQITDRFVDLNRLGRNVEVAVSTYMGRLPGAQQRVIDEFVPWREALGTGNGTNGRSMIDNFNSFVKLQRDKEVALAKSPMVTVTGTAATTGRGVLRGTPVTASGPSGLRGSSAGGTGASHADSMLLELQGQLHPAEWQRIVEADRIRQEALDRMLDERVQSGLISNETRQVLMADYPHYNPTVAMRNVDENLVSMGGGKSINQITNNLRKLMAEGVKDDTEEPAISAIRHVMRSDLDVRRNNAVRTIIDGLRQKDQLGKVERALTPGDRPGTLSWYEDGMRFRGEVPKEIERSAKMMDDNTLNWWLRAGQVANTPLRLAAVTLSPSFIIMNTAADLLTTFIREGAGAAARVPGKHLRAVGQALAPNRFPISEAERRFVRAGGGMSAITQTTEGADIERLIRESGGLVFNDMPAWRRFLEEIGTLKALRRYGEAVERGPRVATFEATLAREAPGRGTAGLATIGGGGFGKGSEASAAMAGRRATIDFARGGQAIRMANFWALFLNARVQGTTQMVRTLRDNPNSRYRLTAVVAAAASTYAWNRQFQEEWADIPEWEKRANAIVILGPGERDPQGGFKSVPRLSFPLREWSSFVAPVTYVFEQMDKKDPRTWDVAAAEIAAGIPGLMGNVARSASPLSGETAESSIMGMLPAPIRTGVSLAQNEKFFTGAPIESARMEDLPPSEKFTDRTTGVAKALSSGSQALSESSFGKSVGMTPISPAQMDFIIQENLAGLGRMATGERLNPLEAVFRTSAGQSDTNKFKKLDKELETGREQIARLTKSHPEYASATRDRQLQMLRQDQLKYEEHLKEKYGISTTTRDYGLPPKYRGVSDPAKEKQIDQAITKYEAWIRDRRARPSERVGVERPSAPEVRLAARYNKDVMRNVSRTRMLQQQRRANEIRGGRVQELVSATR